MHQLKYRILHMTANWATSYFFEMGEIEVVEYFATYLSSKNIAYLAASNVTLTSCATSMVFRKPSQKNGICYQ